MRRQEREGSREVGRIFSLLRIIVFFQIKDVNIVEDGMPVKYSSEVMFSVDKYEIV